MGSHKRSCHLPEVRSVAGPKAGGHCGVRGLVADGEAQRWGHCCVSPASREPRCQQGPPLHEVGTSTGLPVLPPDRTAALVLGGAGRQCVHAAVVVASTLARRTADPGFDERADWWDRYLAYHSARPTHRRPRRVRHVGGIDGRSFRTLAEAWYLDTGRPASRAHPAASLRHLIDEGPQQRCGPSGITAWEPALAGCAWGASSA